jgi:hypothetical protein
MQRIFNLITGLCLCVLSLILSASVALADEGTYSENYPGLRSRGGVANVADSQVRNAIDAFQLVYGRNPGSWAEVVDSGLFDNELRGFQMEAIDPDDASIDFVSDLYIDAGTQLDHDGNILLLDYWNRNTVDVGGPVIEKGVSYKSRIADTLTYAGDQSELIETWLKNEPQLIQFGHVHQLLAALTVYQWVNGKYPKTLTELIETGVGPLNAGSINPMTGQPYKFDGSRGDLLYQLTDENCLGYSLSHVDLNVETDYHFSY